MKPKFRIRQQRGKYALEYLHVTKRLLWFDKQEWKPYFHLLGLPDQLLWFDNMESLRSNFLSDIHIF